MPDVSYKTLKTVRTRGRLVKVLNDDAGVRWYVRLCKECTQEFRSRQPTADFCDSLTCGRAWTKRRILRGLALIDDVLRWRGNRGDKTALADVCHKVSIMLDEDKKAGRPSW